MSRTVLVTGAAGGIGRAVCEAFVQDGWKVLGLDRRGNGETDYEIAPFDIARCGEREACDELRELVADRLGERLDALVNNAAVQVVEPVESLRPEQWQQTLHVNLLAPFYLTQTLLDPLRSARGSVVNIASIHANVTKAGFVAYATSKGALVSLTRALAVELAPEVRVNAVIPAATDTPMLRAGFEGNPEGLATLGSYHPLGRIAEAGEVARVVQFLANGGASFMTGAAVNVDGGIGAVLHDPVFAR